MKKQPSENQRNKLQLRRLTVAELTQASIAGGDGISSHVANCNQTSWIPGCTKKE